MVSENTAGDGMEMSEMQAVSMEEDDGMLDVEMDAEEHQLSQLGGLVPGGGDRPRSGSGAMDLREAVDIWTWDNVGYLAQYFAVGLIYGGLPATVYGFFLGYLAVDGYVYTTAMGICVLPWSFKFLFGLINDTRPIFGYHRKPYMVIGWSLCCVTLVILSTIPMPDPYYCRDSDGQYIREVTNSLGKKVEAEPCNCDAKKSGGKFALLMALAALGYVIADVAADGLTVQYARREPVEVRGQTQTTIYLVRTIGQMCAIMLVAFGMNGPEYNGTFASSAFSWSTLMKIFAIPAALMIPLSWFRVVEAPAADEEDRPTFAQYMSNVWDLLQTKAMFCIMCYTFLNPMVGYIGTTAAGNVKIHWAGVQNLQNQVFSLVGTGIFAIGLALVKKYFLNSSWRMMLVTTTIFLNVVDMAFVYPTIFDLVRNQYFYLGEAVLIEIPTAANFVVATFYIVEMADDGNEGLVYGMVTTVANLGSPVANAISNQIFEKFKPSLSDGKNYIEDDPSFRNTVAESFTLSYFFAFLAVTFVWLLPDQKEEAQQRKKTWGSHIAYAYITSITLSICFIYALLVNFLSMFPSTMCLKFAGGNGCHTTVHHNATTAHCPA